MNNSILNIVKIVLIKIDMFMTQTSKSQIAGLRWQDQISWERIATGAICCVSGTLSSYVHWPWSHIITHFKKVSVLQEDFVLHGFFFPLGLEIHWLDWSSAKKAQKVWDTQGELYLETVSQ